MEPLPPVQLVTLLLAVWGAVLSTITALNNLARDRRVLKVHCWVRQLRGGTPYLLGFSAVNAGHRPVTVINLGWKVGGGDPFVLRQSHFSEGSDTLPITVKDGEAVTLLIEFEVLERAWSQLSLERLESYYFYHYAFFLDAEGNKYKIRRFPREVRRSGLIQGPLQRMIFKTRRIWYSRFPPGQRNDRPDL